VVSSGLSATSAEVLFVVDAQQRIVAWNGHAAQTFGHERGEAIGAPCYELVGATDEAGRAFCRKGCPVITAATECRPTPTLRLRLNNDGCAVPIEVSTILIANDSGTNSVVHLCRPGTSIALPLAEGPAFRLTEREQQILGRLCARETTDQMAAGLRISATTVRNHVQHLLEKLAVHSRAEAVALAYQGRIFRPGADGVAEGPYLR
jgi:PAS domain S-box-containing protein